MGSNFALWYILPSRISVGLRLPLSSTCSDTIPSRHLLGCGKEAQARTVIAQLNGVPEDDALVFETIDELEFGIKAENEGGKATWMECFSSRNLLWKRTINGMMLQFIQQLNGQNFYCECLLVGHTPCAVLRVPAQIIMAILSSRVRALRACPRIIASSYADSPKD